MGFQRHFIRKMWFIILWTLAIVAFSILGVYGMDFLMELQEIFIIVGSLAFTITVLIDEAIKQ